MAALRWSVAVIIVVDLLRKRQYPGQSIEDEEQVKLDQKSSQRMAAELGVEGQRTYEQIRSDGFISVALMQASILREITSAWI